ncbi:hypothetical protein SAMN02799630_00216 [Paenibacillus sp. UNCCL117]|nr:hypothetical protein SAMN04488602_102315 [Paenibacillus sp. cl123]SFW12005.1 hypothetical protein SAMN02799630_00216 [Paenibacillus sp. UNCCL117]
MPKLIIAVVILLLIVLFPAQMSHFFVSTTTGLIESISNLLIENIQLNLAQ